MPSTMRGDDNFDTATLFDWMNAKWTQPTRVASQEYTNSNAFPLEIAVYLNTNVSADQITLLIDGESINVGRAGASGYSGLPNVSCNIPPGSTYEITTTGTIAKWSERSDLT